MALVVVTSIGCTGRSANESAVEGVPTMQLTVSGATPALKLTWAPVTGASAYEVVVLDKAGHAAWSWTGRSTTVTPPPHAPIPAAGSATVAAFTAKHAPIGLSDPVEY